jgi:HSP20 family protein
MPRDTGPREHIRRTTMSDIVVRRGKNEPVVPPAEEPFRWMRDLMRWDPFREMGLVFNMPNEERFVYAPAFEVQETKESFIFRADLPGVKEADLEVMLTGNRLTINGKREAEMQEKNDKYYVYERGYGTFTRSFTLPDGIDVEHLRAELKAGVLTLVLPKKPEILPKKIEVFGEKTKS